MTGGPDPPATLHGLNEACQKNSWSYAHLKLRHKSFEMKDIGSSA